MSMCSAGEVGRTDPLFVLNRVSNPRDTVQTVSSRKTKESRLVSFPSQWRDFLRKSSRRGILLWEAELLDDKGDWKVTAVLFTRLPRLPSFRRGFRLHIPSLVGASGIAACKGLLG